jgi:hypothetical protein
MAPRKAGKTGTGTKLEHFETDGFGNPRFDEIVTLIARNAQAVTEKVFGGKTWPERWLAKGDHAKLKRALAPKREGVRGVHFDVQAPIFQTVLGRKRDWATFDLKEERVGYADIEITFEQHVLTAEFGRWRADWTTLRLLMFCRPVLASMSDTMRAIQSIQSRANFTTSGREADKSDERYGVVTDNRAYRDIFQNAGFYYVCTENNLIDCWGS